MRYEYRSIGRLAPSTGSISAGQGAQLAPDRRLKPHRTGGSAAPEYSAAGPEPTAAGTGATAASETTAPAASPA